jgi:hypothetical protein
MTTIVVCPRCHVESIRWMPFRIVCRHLYHDAADCLLCGWCRTGLPWPPKEDRDDH